ncbi:Transcription initiation factor TFIID subunit 9 [Aspergillus nanangensis]|uniref:Transcription initiation factor TFIID subunit 9 n=1 Tax=Aspergillus nanangensis TaxID=2582783 RepID=A0AAD4CFI1_ASPNN|nr:Transcription initiation factor TFIID subunit 9 [Aspergillus nanangensis]
MASPSQSQPAAPSTQPLTPPAEPSSSNANPPNASQPANTATSTSNAPPPPQSSQPTQIPSTSLKDSGKSRRPRDVRLIHMLLASLGVTSYQERVPVQLLDFAYRYTSGVLQDAVYLATEGYAGVTSETGGGANRGHSEVNSVTLPALRLSIASRLHYQFQTGLPKEFLMDVAAERNRVALPGATRGFEQNAQPTKPQAHQGVMMGGMRLPPERFCLTGTGWDMKEDWDSEGEEVVGEEDDEDEMLQVEQGGRENAEEGDAGDGEDEDGKMEDIFGEDTAMGDGNAGEDGDKEMTDT